MDVRERVMQPVGQAGEFTGKVIVVTGQDGQLGDGLLVGSDPAQGVRQGTVIGCCTSRPTSPAANAKYSCAWSGRALALGAGPSQSLHRAYGRSRSLPDSRHHRHAPLIRRSRRHRTRASGRRCPIPPRRTFKIVSEGSIALLNGRGWLRDGRDLVLIAARGSGATTDVDVQLVARYLPGSAGTLASWLSGGLPWGRSDEVSAELSRRTADLLFCGGCGQWC